MNEREPGSGRLPAAALLAACVLVALASLTVPLVLFGLSYPVAMAISAMAAAGACVIFSPYRTRKTNDDTTETGSGR